MNTYTNILKEKGIDHLISSEELDGVVNQMIDNHDNGHSYCPHYGYEIDKFFRRHLSHLDEIYSVLEERAIDEREKRYEEEGDLEALFDMLDNGLTFFEGNEEEAENLRRYFVISELEKILQIIAEKKIYNRHFHRIKVGTLIDVSQYKNEVCGNQIEFLCDGGWGVTDDKGVVIISNELVLPPSKCEHLTNNLYRTINRDNKRHGIIYKGPIKEVLHCEYPEINLESAYLDGEKHNFVKVKKDWFWACFDCNGNKILDFEFSDIKFRNGFIECIKHSDYCVYNDHCLYDFSGKILVRDYKEGSFGLKHYCNYFCFYSKLLMDRWYGDNYNTIVPFMQIPRPPLPSGDTDNSEPEYSLTEPSFYLPFSLILDNNFDSFIKDAEKGTIKLEQVGCWHYENLPISIFVPGEINIISYPIVVSDVSLTPEFARSRCTVVNSAEPFLDNRKSLLHNLIYEEKYVVTEAKFCITHLNEKGHVDWHSFVEDFRQLYRNDGTLYRNVVQIGSKVGAIYTDGIVLTDFNAISLDSKNKNKIYVAKIIKFPVPAVFYDNPNFSQAHNQMVMFFEVLKDGSILKLSDDKNIFAPDSVEWFPKNFLGLNLDSYPIL